MKTYDESLFPQEFLKKFDFLNFLLKNKIGSGKEGEGKTRKQGGTFDFSGYSPYSLGDDLRYVDWNVYARLDQLIVKKFMFSQRFHMLILVDSSASMSIGDKFQTACRMAALLGYSGKKNGYSVRFAFLQQERPLFSPTFFYRQSIEPMLAFLSWKKAQGKISIDRLLLSICDLLPKSYIFLLSDLLDAQSAKKRLEQARIQGHEIALFHILAPEEISPPIAGQTTLKDIQRKEKKILFLNQESLKKYHLSLQNFREKWFSFCLKHGIQYIFSTTRPDYCL